MDVLLMPLVNVTLFPKTTKPLNIFEPQYLEMVRYSIKTQTPVAIGFKEDAQSSSKDIQDLSSIRSVAGYGSVQIVEERSNGTLLVFVQGLGKVKLISIKDAQNGFLICEGEPIPENNLILDPGGAKVQSLFKILTRWIHTHIPDPMQRELFLKSVVGPEEIIGAFSSYLVRDYDLQQMILEIDDINEKIRFLLRLVESTEIS